MTERRELATDGGQSADGPSGQDERNDERAEGGPASGDGADWPPTGEKSHALADRLSERVVPLDGTDPATALDDLDPLVDRLRDARVVGLGEATHGTREFFQLKHRLIRLMVERLDCRVVAMEANFTETLAIDEYVVHGRGDPRDALDGVYFWTWDTEEVLALLEWLREFNADRPLDDRVRFYGVDAQFTAGPAEALLGFFEERDPDALDGRRETLEMLADKGLKDDEPEDVIDERVADAEATVDALLTWFDDCDEGDDAVALHRRHARTLEQAVAVNDAKGEEATEELLRIRDRAMADNLSWVIDRESADRIAVWAHDAHLQRESRSGEWGDAAPMGEHLADRYGGDYYAVGFDFADGEFQAMVDTDDGYELQVCSIGPPPEDAATRLFAAVDDPVWFVDFDEATEDERLAEWFDDERTVRSLGAVYDPDGDPDDFNASYRLPENFDGLVFVGETGRARPIERE